MFALSSRVRFALHFACTRRIKRRSRVSTLPLARTDVSNQLRLTSKESNTRPPLLPQMLQSSYFRFHCRAVGRFIAELQSKYHFQLSCTVWTSTPAVLQSFVVNVHVHRSRSIASESPWLKHKVPQATRLRISQLSGHVQYLPWVRPSASLPLLMIILPFTQICFLLRHCRMMMTCTLYAYTQLHIRSVHARTAIAHIHAYNTTSI